MAAAFSITSDFNSSIKATNLTTIKTLSKSGITSIPSSFASNNLQDLAVIDPSEAEIPIIDFSLLTSGNTEEKCKTVKDLGKALEEWGFFMLVNHGIPESLIMSMMEGIKGFFDLSDDEKREFCGKNVVDPIRCGSSFNTAMEKVNCWRDFLKAFVHPEFHCPHKPAGFSETAYQYLEKVREVIKELLKGVSESLGLEANYINKAVNIESGLQVLIANLYPPCPQPELAVGIHPHSDHGLLSILVENGISGFQTQHNGKWVRVHAPPNALMVNTADQLEVVTNGKYKSNIHRAVLYSNATRISVVIANGPSFDDIVSPAPDLVNCWRDFLKCFVYPEFHFPHKPAGFRDTASEYINKTREVKVQLLEGVSESLGLEPNYLSKALNLDLGLERFVANPYPPCPQPELTMGIYPHTDPGLLTILLENGISGLQILHNGKWFRVCAPSNALMVNIADQLEIVSNGKYKSAAHRATLHSKAMTTRMSLATSCGPSPDKVIRPAPELVNESHPPAYAAITHREYI